LTDTFSNVSPLGSLFVADAYNELIRIVLVPFDLGIQKNNDAVRRHYRFIAVQ